MPTGRKEGVSMKKVRTFLFLIIMFSVITFTSCGGGGTSSGGGGGGSTSINELYVSNGTADSITVYSRTADGNIAPVRTITGAATNLSALRGIAVDTANNEIFVANWANSITVYSRAADGNIAPVRTITGAATNLNGPVGIAVLW